MSFLSKFGKVALEVGRVSATLGVPFVGPAVSVVDALVPKGGDRIPTITPGSEFAAIAALALQVEVMGQIIKAPGPEKLKMAAPFVGPIILASPFMRGKKVHDPTLFSQGCTKLMDGTADLLNSLDEDGV